MHSLPIEPTVVAALRAPARQRRPLSPADALEVMRDSYRNYVAAKHAELPRAVCPSAGGPRAAGDPLHRRQGPHRICLRADPACARRADDVIAEDYLLTNRFYRRDPSASSDLPDDVRQVLGSVETSFLAAAFEAIGAEYGDLETYFSDGLGLGAARTRNARSAIPGVPEMLPSLGRADIGRSGRRFHFGVEIGNDVLECRDRLLDRGNLHQLPAVDRTVAVLQRDNQIPPLLLKLNQR